MPRLYVTADWSRLVPEDSPEAAFYVREEDARERGLLKQAQRPPDKAVHHPPEDKALSPRPHRPGRTRSEPA